MSAWIDGHGHRHARVAAVAATIAVVAIGGCGGDDNVATRTGVPDTTAAAPGSPTAAPRSQRAVLRCPTGDKVFGASPVYTDDPEYGADTPERALDLWFMSSPVPPERANTTAYRYNDHSRRAEISYDLDGRTVLVADVIAHRDNKWVVSELKACNTFMTGREQ